MISTDQPWPSVHSQSSKLMVNKNGSIDVWFGPEPPPDNKTNWIKTIHEKGWNMILRLYYPMETWFDKTWRPGEIEQVK